MDIGARDSTRTNVELRNERCCNLRSMRRTTRRLSALVMIAATVAGCDGTIQGDLDAATRDVAARDAARDSAAIDATVIDATREGDAATTSEDSAMNDVVSADQPAQPDASQPDASAMDAAPPLRCGTGFCRSEFTFRQQMNGMPLPSEPTGNGYIRVNFPSHSRVATPIGSTINNANSASAWWLYAEDGTLVASIEDDLGGFHPNFFDAPEVTDSANASYARYQFVRDWIMAFRAFGPFVDARSRGNNHMPEYDRYVLEGTYRWRYQNRANIPVRLECGLIRASSGHGDLDRVIAPGETVEVMLPIRANPMDAFDNYKINTNGY